MRKNHNIGEIISWAMMIGLLTTMAACGGDKKNSCKEPETFGKAIGCAMAPRILGEFKPNSSLDNASVVTLPIAPANSPAAVEINGSVQSADNFTDSYIFTPHRSGSYSVFLCADTCAGVVQDDAVYIMVYDQSQTTIAATPIGSVVGQELSANLTSGLAYYVQVRGYNTGQENYDYRLIIIG